MKIAEVIHSKTNPSLVKELVQVEFLPEYIEYLQQISRRYIPLETIRKIKKDNSTDKTRHFLYKLCFKFAGIKKNECILSLEECMNLGKFYNNAEHSLKRKWRPIEKALEKGKEYKLLNYTWIFREPTQNEINQDKLSVDLFGFIDVSSIGLSLEDKHYKYIEQVQIVRAYHLTAPSISLPFNLEEAPAIKPRSSSSIEI